MKTIYQYDWHDSVIERIEIEERNVILHITLDDAEKSLFLQCRDVIGVSDLCMWEDTIVFDLKLNIVQKLENDFLKKIESSHPNYSGYNKPIKDGLLDLAITLINDMTFHIYCYDVGVKENFPN